MATARARRLASAPRQLRRNDVMGHGHVPVDWPSQSELETAVCAAVSSRARKSMRGIDLAARL
ncbi:hypothetical protein XH88_32750 [Bradyrhizobium sp. CCBAU 51627]|nr:hypothetical protein [Bradyrhizobium sp. CCBAU 51627]